MIRLGGNLLHLVCDRCEDRVAIVPATAEVIAATSAIMAGTYLLGTFGIEEPAAVREQRAEVLDAAVRDAIRDLPTGWTREIRDGRPQLTCAVCLSVNRAESTAAGARRARSAGGTARTIHDDDGGQS